ncbi:MAG: hypothetical protein GEU26_18535 [Nitrososphaeraceae archaeon]|nr:hypothetical protein [Nitrososphaeraceae archaeon]
MHTYRIISIPISNSVSDSGGEYDLQSYDNVDKIYGDYAGFTSTVGNIYEHRGKDEQSRVSND